MLVHLLLDLITCAVRVKSKEGGEAKYRLCFRVVPPHRMSVIENYTQGVGIDIRKIPHNEDGFLDLNVAAKETSGSCAIYVGLTKCIWDSR